MQLERLLQSLELRFIEHMLGGKTTKCCKMEFLFRNDLMSYDRSLLNLELVMYSVLWTMPFRMSHLERLCYLWSDIAQAHEFCLDLLVIHL